MARQPEQAALRTASRDGQPDRHGAEPGDPVAWPPRLTQRAAVSSYGQKAKTGDKPHCRQTRIIESCGLRQARNTSPSVIWSPYSLSTATGNSFVGPTTCPGYGGPFCTYPFYAFNRTLNALTFGGDYPGTSQDFGQVLQFQQTENCTSPQGGSPQYCATILK